MSKKNAIILLVIIILVGAFFRIFPVRYDSARLCDIQAVTEAFDLGDNIVKGNFSIFKIPVDFPYLFSYLLLFFYGIFYCIGRLAGLFVSAGQFINYIFFHIDNFYDFARILMGILGTALIPLVYIVTSKIAALKNNNLKSSRLAGLFAAFLMAINLLHIHSSHQERPHIVVSVFIFLSFYFFIRFLEKKNLISSLLLGLGVGLAAGSLQNGLIALTFFVLIVLFTKFKCLSSIKFWAGIATFLIIFILCYPYLFLSFAQTIHSEVRGLDITLSGGEHVPKDFSFSGKGFNEIVKGIFNYDPSLVLILILSFLIYLVLKNGLKKEKLTNFSQPIIGAAILVGLYVLIFSFYDGLRFRFLTPLIPFLCFFVGVLFGEILNKFRKRYLKAAFTGILILFLLFSLIQALRFNYLMFKQETRGLAKDWIESNISKSDLIALESDQIRFVPFKENLQFQLLLEPDSISRKDKFLLTLDDEFYPKESRAILRFWVFKQGAENYQFLKERGVKYFVVSKETIQGFSESRLEPEIISGGGELIISFNPFINKDSLRHSRFYSEFLNPIIDLWALKRLGPIIEIYRL